MAVLRQFNILGQERLDVPHFRAMESAVVADFDLLMGMMVCGKRSFVLNGFKVVTTGAIGAKATALQVATAGSKIAHYNASESGTIFFVPADRATEVLAPTNSRVTGSFTANTTNYVGIDVRRAADDSTADTAMFLDADTHKETPKTVPLGRTLDYVFVISTTDFTSTPTVAALAKVTTDASNNVTALEDARNLLFRLGKGGSVPDFKNAYSWPEGRLETLTGDVFTGGDRAITDLKSWMDSVMTRVWEVGGGERWFSSVADRNVKMVKTGTFFANGEYFEWDGTHLHWKGVRFTFPNSTGYYNDVADQVANLAGLTDLADGDCIYVDLDFSQNRTGGSAIVAAKTSTRLLGSPTIPGGRYIVAWRVGTSIFVRDGAWPVNSHFTPATTTSLGVVKLSYAPVDPLAPVVLTDTERNRPGPANGQPGGVAGLWRTSASRAYDVLGTGLKRGASQGAGNIYIGNDTLTTGVLIGMKSKSSTIGAGFLVRDEETLSFSGYNAVMAAITNQGISRFSVAAIGDIGDFRHATGVSYNSQEQDITAVTLASGFEDVQHTGAGAGTVTVQGVTGGAHRSYQVWIVTSGGLGVGEFSLSYDGGLSFPTGVVGIPGGGSWYDATSGIVLTFAGVFVQDDIYYFRPRFVPQLTTKDAAGHVRYVIDHNGLPLGRYSDFRENWMAVWTAVNAIPAGSPAWGLTAAAGTTVSSRHADAFFNAPYVTQDAPNTTNGDVISLYTNRFFAYIGDPVTFVAEWEAGMNNTTDKTVQYGLRDGVGFGNGGIWFEKSNGGGWTCNAGATSINSGFSAPGEGNISRFRLEVIGKSIPVGGSAQRTARFFINDTLVAEINSNQVGAGPFLFSMVTKATANNQVIYTAIGPLQCTWARLLSAPAL